ncbi:MAG TPA: hypothetical protein VF032_07185 [Thermoleophilaceae bacterium]
MKFRQGVAVALVIATSLGAAASSAHAARGMEVGLQDDAVFLYQSYYNRDLALQQAKQLGVTRLRVNVLWNRIASAQNTQKSVPSRVIYSWYPYDSIVDAAKAYGIKVQMTVAGPAPAWANGKHRAGLHNGAYRPNARLYGRFIHDVAVHFKGRVDRYSVWNEPNWPGWLAPYKSAPRLYAALYRAGYAGVKSADPNAKVLFGELAPQERRHKSLGPLTFIRRATRHTHFKADGFAHHPYAFNVSPTSRRGGRNDVTMGTLGRLTRLLHTLAHRRKLRTPHGGTVPVYLTEYGFFASGPRKLSAKRRAAYLRKAFSMALHTPSVREMTQYTLVAPPSGWDTSLVSLFGNPSSVFNSLSSWTLGAVHAGRVARSPR